jgi:hypothetical protein
MRGKLMRGLAVDQLRKNEEVTYCCMICTARYATRDERGLEVNARTIISFPEVVRIDRQR